MWRRTGITFNTKSKDGKSFRVLEEVDILDVGDFDDPAATLEGLKRYTTTAGHHVNRISDSEYEVLNAGPLLEEVRVTRLD